MAKAPAPSGDMFSIIRIGKGDGAIILNTTVTVVSRYLIVVIVLSIGVGSVVVSFVVVLLDIKTIVLEDVAGGISVAAVVNDEGAGAINSTHPAFIWDR